jgi:hypothetical protein
VITKESRLMPQYVQVLQIPGSETFELTTRHMEGEEQHRICERVLKSELEHTLLFQLFADPQNCSFGSFERVDDDAAMIILRQGTRYARLWFGHNPETKEEDGLVHVSGRAPEVWQSYQRMSDGSYFRKASRFGRGIDYAEKLSGV